jgi:glutaredoxin
LEVARNPSDENIRLWMTYLDKKNFLAERLRNRITAFASKGAQPAVPRAVQERVVAQAEEKPDFDPSRFRIRTYFESTCPHCKRMLQTLRELQDRGIYVEALQIDRNQVSEAKYPIATSLADPADVKKNGIQSVPFTLVADLKAKTVLNPISGFKSVSEMTELLKLMAKSKH